MKEIKNGITVVTDKLNYPSFFKKCQDFKAIICPVGNGLDTHRFYETLLMNRVPILIKLDNYKIYDEIY